MVSPSSSGPFHEVGHVIAGRYRVTGVLGRGGLGVTYEAVFLPSGARVAVKQLAFERLQDWKALELFEREARVLAQLTHPAIPKYLEHFREESPRGPCLYIAQELANGRSLAARVAEGFHVDEAGARRIAVHLLRVLSYLHGLMPPVIHRDIKPGNVILADDGSVSLVDFGAVRDTLRSELTASTVVGTYGYMAPEQFRGHAVPATDLHGLGATLLFLLTGRSPAELPQRQLRIDFRGQVNVSPEFAQWLDRVLAPAPEDRFPSAREALTDLLTGGPAKPAPVRRRTLALAAILGVVVAGGGAWLALSRRPKPVSPATAAATTTARGGGKRIAPVQTLTGHWSAVFGVAYSPDGAQIATASWDDTLKLWDARTGEAIRAFAGHTGHVGSVAFTSDGNTLVSGGDVTVRLWDRNTGAAIRTLAGHAKQVTGVAVAPGDRWVVSSGADGEVRVWDAGSGALVRTMRHPPRALAVTVSPDGRYIVSGGDDRTVRVWAFDDGKLVHALTGHEAAVDKVVVSGDGTTLVSAGDDKTVRVWSLGAGKLMRTLKGHEDEVWALAMAADGKSLASGGKDDTIRVWDVFTGESRMSITAGMKGVLALAFTPDGSRLAAGGGNNLVHVWALGETGWRPPLAEPVAAAPPPAPASDAREEDLACARARELLDDDHDGGDRDAKREVDRALAIAPQHALAHALLGRVTYRLGYKSGEDYDPAALAAAHRHFDRALELDSQLVLAYVWKGYAFMFQKDLVQARTMAEKADTIAPSSFEATILLGEIAFKRSDHDEVLRRARRVLDTSQEPRVRSLAYGLLRDVFNARRDWEGVDICHRSMIALRPQSAWKKGNYAAFLVRRKEADRAIEMAKAALAQMDYGIGRRTLSDAYALKAHQTLFDKHDEAGAAELLELAMKTDARNADVYYERGLYLRAIAASKKEPARLAEAQAALRKALALEPDHERAKRALREIESGR